MKPTLFVLAAGMGSRYGGLKQLDGLGPNGETIMDYSIFDALRAGFGKVVFVIRRDFEEDFREKILSKYDGHIPTELVFQAVDNLPAGFTSPDGRTKPWGTSHAVLMAKDVIKEPFAVINADDFYGKESYEIICKWLSEVQGEGRYCMVGYRVGNTLSKSGTVARGVCETNSERALTKVTERTTIERKDDRIIFTDESGNEVELEANTPVSMNMWGFTPDYFQRSEREFCKFLDSEIQNPKSECVIPRLISPMIERKEVTVEVLDTPSSWFGVTYAADREGVVNNIQELILKGLYPEKLW